MKEEVVTRYHLLAPADMTPERRRVYVIFAGVRKARGWPAKGTPYQIALCLPEFTEKW